MMGTYRAARRSRWLATKTSETQASVFCLVSVVGSLKCPLDETGIQLFQITVNGRTHHVGHCSGLFRTEAVDFDTAVFKCLNKGLHRLRADLAVVLTGLQRCFLDDFL